VKILDSPAAVSDIDE